MELDDQDRDLELERLLRLADDQVQGSCLLAEQCRDVEHASQQVQLVWVDSLSSEGDCANADTRRHSQRDYGGEGC